MRSLVVMCQGEFLLDAFRTPHPVFDHLLPMGEGHKRESGHAFALSYGERVPEGRVRGWNLSEIYCPLLILGYR